MFESFGSDVNLVRMLVAQSPPKLGGVPSRSEGGAVCSKTRSDLMDFRAALLINPVRFAEIHKERFARASPPNLGGDYEPHAACVSIWES